MKEGIASWSGGKDSCLAVYRMLRRGAKITTLLNFISLEERRGCFHGINGKVLERQGELIGIPLVQWPVSPDMALYEKSFKEAVSGFIAKGTREMVFGDIYLQEHEDWVARVCKELGIISHEPLWGEDPESLVKEFIGAGFRTVIISCRSELMGKEFLGQALDMEMVAEFKRRNIDPCGERGEFHTLVVDGPIFKRPLELVRTEVILKEGFWPHWFMDITEFH